MNKSVTHQNHTDCDKPYILHFNNIINCALKNLLSSSLPSKNLKIKIYRNITLSVVLYGCETWSLTLKEERRLRVYENRLLREYLGLGGTG